MSAEAEEIWRAHIEALMEDVAKEQWLNVLAHLNRMNMQALQRLNDKLKGRA